MKWFKKLLELRRETGGKSNPTEDARKEALRIEELEARLAPSAIWGE
jgi:hypothetical protein